MHFLFTFGKASPLKRWLVTVDRNQNLSLLAVEKRLSGEEEVAGFIKSSFIMCIIFGISSFSLSGQVLVLLYTSWNIRFSNLTLLSEICSLQLQERRCQSHHHSFHVTKLVLVRQCFQWVLMHVLNDILSLKTLWSWAGQIYFGLSWWRDLKLQRILSDNFHDDEKYSWAFKDWPLTMKKSFHDS